MRQLTIEPGEMQMKFCKRRVYPRGQQPGATHAWSVTFILDSRSR